jgi:beta-phosphoglucomutase
MIQAVIFDFDGVIGDTMADNCTAWQKAFEPYGFQLLSADYYRLEGMGRFQIAEYIIEHNKLGLTNVSEIVEAKELYYKHHNTFRIYDHVNEIFNLLRSHGIGMAIVTGASKSRITEHLGKELSSQLSALITADDVKNTKPHPEPYLKAVAHLGKKAEDCLVIENAILGVMSAKAAGCPCFALETTLTAADLTLADEVFPAHKDLLTRFQTMF